MKKSSEWTAKKKNKIRWVDAYTIKSHNIVWISLFFFFSLLLFISKAYLFWLLSQREMIVSILIGGNEKRKKNMQNHFHNWNERERKNFDEHLKKKNSNDLPSDYWVVFFPLLFVQLLFFLLLYLNYGEKKKINEKQHPIECEWEIKAQMNHQTAIFDNFFFFFLHRNLFNSEHKFPSSKIPKLREGSFFLLLLFIGCVDCQNVRLS